MKIKRLKGFTLIECIVAMAIIGLTSMLMVQVYSTVAKMNRENNRMNNSMEKQMEYAESQIVSATGDSNVNIVCISSYNNASADVKNNSNFKVEFNLKKGSDTNANKANKFSGAGLDTCTADVNFYVIGVDTSQDDTTGKVYDESNAIRYKFILPKDVDD